jgi:hypothetical protein
VSDRTRAWQMNAISEDWAIAQQAANWVERLKTPSAQGSAEFMRWVRRSPLHVREVLLAMTIDAELDRIDPDHKIDIDELIAQSVSNVVRIGERAGVDPQATRRVRARWPWLAAAGAAAVLLLVLGGFIGVMNVR